MKDICRAVLAAAGINPGAGGDCERPHRAFTAELRGRQNYAAFSSGAGCDGSQPSR